MSTKCITRGRNVWRVTHVYPPWASAMCDAGGTPYGPVPKRVTPVMLLDRAGIDCDGLSLEN